MMRHSALPDKGAESFVGVASACSIVEVEIAESPAERLDSLVQLDRPLKEYLMRLQHVVILRRHAAWR